jgi:hypothetical protein
MKLSESTEIITFDKSTAKDILSCFGKSVDKDGYIVESDDLSKKIFAEDGMEITLKEFAGIRKGADGKSVIFIRSDLPSLIDLLDIIKGN